MFACLFFMGGKYHVTVIAGWGRLAVQERAKLLQPGGHLSLVYTAALPWDSLVFG